MIGDKRIDNKRIDNKRIDDEQTCGTTTSRH